MTYLSRNLKFEISPRQIAAIMRFRSRTHTALFQNIVRWRYIEQYRFYMVDAQHCGISNPEKISIDPGFRDD